MKHVCLLLSTPGGDELGRLPLEGWSVADTGEDQSSEIPAFDDHIADLEEAIVAAIAEEGMSPAIDAIQLEITVTRALLMTQDHSDVLIRIPVLDGGEIADTGALGSCGVDSDLFALEEDDDANASD